MRTQKALKNTISNVMNYLLITILRFIVRYIFIMYLGIELLGLNGVFTSLIAVFSLAELGFGIAIGQLMYKPMADNDIEKIKSYSAVTKKAFRFVGIFVAVGGLSLTPFLSLFLKDNIIPINEVRIYYVLFIAYSIVSYFNVHKGVLIQVDQKTYIYRRYTMIFTFIASVLQIGAIIAFKSFYIFLAITVVTTILQNVFVSMAANKLFPYIKEKNVQKLTDEEKKDLTKKILGLSLLKVGAIIITSSTSIIISSFISVEMVGYYSNYALIIMSVQYIASNALEGCTASIGNLWVTESTDKVIIVFKKLLFIQYWIATFTSTCLLVLLEPFISIWLGNDFLLGQLFVIVIVMNYYITIMRIIVNSFKSTKGLFWKDRFNTFIQAVVNVAASLVLVNFLGLLGVFIGALVGLCSLPIWNEPRILYKFGFGLNCRGYLLDYFVKLVIASAIASITYFTCFLLGSGVIMFIVKMLICAILPNVLLFLVFFKTAQFKSAMEIIKNLTSRRKKEINNESNTI